MYSIKKENIEELLILVFIKIVLEYSYINFICPVFKYEGFIYAFNIFNYIIGWMVFFVLYLILNLKRKLYIYGMYNFLFLIYIIPNIVYFSLSNQNTKYFFYIITSFIFIVLLTINNFKMKIKTFKYGKFLILLLLLLIILITIIHYFISTNGHMVFKFSEVYKFRTEFGNKSNGGIFGYLNSWTPKVFISFMLAWSLFNKNNFFLLLIIFFNILLFFLSGHKSVIIPLAIIPMFYYFYNKNNFKTFSLSISKLFLIFLIFILTISVVFDTIFFSSLLLRRLLFIPPYLNFVYFDFFSGHSFAYWGNSVLKFIIHYPYDTTLPNVIGIHLGHPRENANTGYIASGFAQGGVFGIIVYTGILTILMNIINQMAKSINLFFIYSVTFVAIKSAYISSDLLTVMLTHGVFVSLISLYLYKENKIYLLKFQGKKICYIK